MSGGENQRTPRLMIRAEQLRACHFCSAFSRALESPLQAGSSPFTGLRIELESIDINRYQSYRLDRAPNLIRRAPMECARSRN